MSRNRTSEMKNFLMSAHNLFGRISNLECAIEERDEKLRDIAYILSHIVRAPLARLKGLIQVNLDMDLTEEEKKEYFILILKSADELDDVIKKIVRKTD